MEKLRTHQILQYLKERRRCTVEDLQTHFGVSRATIHRDMDELARRDAVIKVRGGLVFNEAVPRTGDATDYQERVVANRSAKAEIARRALAFVSEGDILFLDSSTTVFEFAMLLRAADFQHLTVVTNSVAIMNTFRKFPDNCVLIGLGGSYDPQLNSFLGSVTLEQLARLNITSAFVSAFGLDERNATTNHERQAELMHRVLDAAERRYLLLDDSKFGRRGLYRLAARGSFTQIITNQERDR